MWGWLRRESASASFRKRARASSSAEKPRRQHLHRHVAAQLLVPGAVHLAHAPAPSFSRIR